MQLIDAHPNRISSAVASGGISSEPIYQAVLWALSSLEANGSVLDFGAGTGNLSRVLCGLDCFTSVMAADIYNFGSDSAHPKLRWLYGDLNEPLKAQDAAFDAIVAVEVIEHLENPRFLAREWFRLLRPGGALVLSTPNNESLRSLLCVISKGHFAAFTGNSYPAHITALLRRDLDRILAEAGFTQVCFSFTNDGCLPKLTRLTWQSLSLGVLRGLRYSDNLVCTAIKPVIVPGSTETRE